jgi:regulator of replication initiation timing
LQRLKEQGQAFERFRSHVADLVGKAIINSEHDKALAHKSYELEDRLTAQACMLEEAQSEVARLREETKCLATDNENLRTRLTEMEDREAVFADTLNSEKAKLQGGLERANGERLRLAYELANLKRSATWANSELANEAGENGRAA